MKKEQWDIFDKRHQHVEDQLHLLARRISELENNSTSYGYLSGEVNRLEQEIERLNEENAVLAGKDDDPGSPYGYELVLDLQGCQVKTFTRSTIRRFFIALCKAIDMRRCDLHFWDDRGVPTRERQTAAHTQGTSAVQFILTSTVVIHTLVQLGAAYINVFSCKRFDPATAEALAREWFGAKGCRARFLVR